MPRPYVLAETTWRTVDQTPYEVAVLPWGATEAHNRHLPYATDNYQAEHVAIAAAARAWERGAKVVVLPTIPFGVQTGQLDIKLCLNLNPSTQALVLGDLVRALDGQGLRKLVIVNSHGGNDFRQMIRELQPKTRVFLSAVNWYRIIDPKGWFEDLGDHAGEMETSAMLHIAPELVEPLRPRATGTSGDRSSPASARGGRGRRASGRRSRATPASATRTARRPPRARATSKPRWTSSRDTSWSSRGWGTSGTSEPDAAAPGWLLDARLALCIGAEQQRDRRTTQTGTAADETLTQPRGRHSFPIAVSLYERAR